MNTRTEGEVNILIVFDESSKEYIGICPEFAMVKYADNLQELKLDMINGSRAYVTAVVENDMPHELLNRSEELPEKFQILYNAFTERMEKKKNTPLFDKLPTKFKTAIESGDAYMMVPTLVGCK